MKKHIKLILRTLFSNNACVEAARTKEKKYNIIAVIFALFALFFAAMPTCVTGFQQKGGNWIRGGTYSFENGMIQLKEKMGDNVSIRIEDSNGKHKLVADNWKTDTIGKYEWKDVTQNELPCSIATMPDHEGDPKAEHKVLEVFVCPENLDFNIYVEEIAKNINPLNIIGKYKNKDEKKKLEETEGNWLEKTTEKKDGKDVPVRVNRTTSFIVLGATEVQGALYQPGNTSVASSVYGDYQNTPITASGKDFIKDVLVVDPNNITQILENCQTFFDQVYINPRFKNTWKSTGIILGVDTGVVILMGFMVWILTRGKNNPFRIYSFWDGQKIAYYASLTPGIISLFGFLMSNMAMMLFILGVGVRVMWLSMRTLRYQAPAKQ